VEVGSGGNVLVISREGLAGGEDVEPESCDDTLAQALSIKLIVRGMIQYRVPIKL
jgi:hypothetical protein